MAATFKNIKSLQPLFDRVLVQRFKPETKTASGIFLPSSAASTPLPEATVIAVGPGAPGKDGKVVPTSVQAGDRVLLPGWGGSSIKVGEEFPLGYQFNLTMIRSEKLDWLVDIPHLYFSAWPYQSIAKRALSRVDEL
ncbi:hypothetical protein A1Q1_03552 [Trichosporon asahii var. asahii CBS 2479]|uniref:20 kDa chaperonin, chloroplastic n=1 Tax=Trichosporon asahii var. asahii (strain ATCC 90039 / CBS 2479 / JCM 2466 / KCTC 7840 / NBRC 103889/ NCYC 2677 / UAMH 7654) TaxID=1186058 RepID=J6ESR9_TRIAS|nr:hypothetical protein A1Q1_03552 [Trichosporon asahii var. asahii CBS 2479]EJT47579.1 hypothetical protein A1Q1_03552 [Trichosporon asahii var. asahii CBS 2479]